MPPALAGGTATSAGCVNSAPDAWPPPPTAATAPPAEAEDILEAVDLTAWDNLLLWYDKNTLKQELESGVLAMLGIPEFIKVPVNKMSGGMKKRLAIGCVVAANPKVLLLDEPSAALDLVCKERIYNYLKDYKQQGGRILLATHDVQELDLCDKWYILKNGFLTPYEYDGNVHHLVGKL